MPKPPAGNFTDRWIRERKPPSGQLDYFETQKTGRSLVLTLNTSGRKSWSVMFYANGKPKRRKLGYFDHHDAQYPELTTKQARQLAADFDVKGELIRTKSGSFREVAEAWFNRHASKLRSRSELRRHLDSIILPAWGDVPFCDIRRGEVNALLDKIEDQRGANQADAVLATIRSIMNWQQSRDENYSSPIVKGMRRNKDKQARERILDDEEIREVWKAADELGGAYSAIIKLCLLTGQRKAKVAQMRWEDIEDGVWTIATEPREKGNPGKLPLPQVALDLIEAQPSFVGNRYVFGSSRSRKQQFGHFNAWSQGKRDLDRLLPPMPHWQVHDLRRTARSLMSRIGVQTEIAERVLGHKQPGIIDVYDRHKYEAEMGKVLLKLAAELNRILNPESKVVPFRA